LCIDEGEILNRQTKRNVPIQWAGRRLARAVAVAVAVVMARSWDCCPLSQRFAEQNGIVAVGS